MSKDIQIGAKSISIKVDFNPKGIGNETKMKSSSRSAVCVTHREQICAY